MNNEHESAKKWICYKCHENLVLETVRVKYLEGSFEVELARCPSCHLVLITEELALGKMLEVEKGLEDK